MRKKLSIDVQVLSKPFHTSRSLRICPLRSLSAFSQAYKRILNLPALSNLVILDPVVDDSSCIERKKAARGTCRLHLSKMRLYSASDSSISLEVKCGFRQDGFGSEAISSNMKYGNINASEFRHKISNSLTYNDGEEIE